MSCVLARSLEEHIEVHRIIESSNRLTVASSSRDWSNTETGDTVVLEHLTTIICDDGRTEDDYIDVVKEWEPCRTLKRGINIRCLRELGVKTALTDVRQPPTSKIRHSQLPLAVEVGQDRENDKKQWPTSADIPRPRSKKEGVFLNAYRP